MCALPVIVVPTQRVLPGKAWHVDVISNEHHVTHVEAGIEPPRCICHNQSLHTQQEEHSNRVRHLEETTCHVCELETLISLKILLMEGVKRYVIEGLCFLHKKVV